MKKFIPILGLILTLFTACQEDFLGLGLLDGVGAPIEYDDSRATRRLKVASVCMECSQDADSNFMRMVYFIEQVKTEHPDIRLIVFGETTLGWYYKPDEPEAYQRRVAETVPGPATDSVASLAELHDLYVVFGLSEIRGRDLYNTQVLINPDGEIQAQHSKRFLTGWDVVSGFESGDGFVVTEIDSLKAGMIICADLHSEYLSRNIAGEDIDILIHSLANLGGVGPDIDVIARRFDAWVVFANRYGQEDKNFYTGQIYISDPVGAYRIQSEDSAGFIYYDLGVY
ncbi:carbon-nitrogen hydrolase family protein [candidate division WOR-3 bacterium]|nr:carbon-nitrogen hydrolase family protein [candidate division WOR-3 bacterium]